MEEDKIHLLSFPIAVHTDCSLESGNGFPQQKYQPWESHTFTGFVDFAF